MGREIRKVPALWEHPKTTRWDYRLQKDVECYKPLYDDREAALKSFAADIENVGLAEAIDYHGGGPKSADYVDFEGKEPTWWQVYETVSEGTPVTPPFETREELVEYLVENGDFWDQIRRKEGRSSMPCEPWSRRNAEAFVMGRGWAPSMVIDGGKIMSGVEALSQENADVVAPPPLDGGGEVVEKRTGGCPPTPCSPDLHSVAADAARITGRSVEECYAALKSITQKLAVGSTNTETPS